MSVDDKTLVVSALATDSFVAVNKKALRHFSGNAILAVVLCELISIYKFQKLHGKVDEFGAFPVPTVFLQKTLRLSAYKQKHAFDKLQAASLLSVTIMGKPASRFITLDFTNISKILLEEDPVQIDKIQFYNKLSTAASDGILNKDESSLGNIKAPLRGAIVMMSNYIREKHEQVIWTSEAVGLLKLVLRSFQKQELFDYGRLQDLCDACDVDSNEARTMVYEMQKKWKRIAERSPNRRMYEYRSV